MSAEVPVETIRRAAASMRERAGAATNGGHGWRVADLPGANEVWADRDAAGYDAFMVATTATRLNPNPGTPGHADATHIASWHPAVALAVADWLDREAVLHDALGGAMPQALAVARAYLGESA